MDMDMDIKLNSNFAWVYCYNSNFEEILGLHKNEKIPIPINNIDYYDITKLTSSYQNIDDIKTALDKGNLKEAAEMMGNLKNNVEDDFCQVILNRRLNYFFVFCKDIRSWKKELELFSKFTVVNKRIVKELFLQNFSNNLVNINLRYEESDSNENRINTNFNGSNIQNTPFFSKIFDEEVKVTINSCLFQPINRDFLITLKKVNKIEISKYVLPQDIIEYFDYLLSFIKAREVNDDK